MFEKRSKIDITFMVLFILSLIFMYVTMSSV
ncbi:hypothetical protein EDD68_10124 [Melghiribacillus thermohalophilus]|uniref:Uncharacterized protein n=1 Tax=Melghiribacillus thermohalophilus TaxID=1324956 RepID=A0A4V2V2V3_9BACI|nr:hypothetical protein EDD68_10124 [Melghiribacillus thermohalophilus]